MRVVHLHRDLFRQLGPFAVRPVLKEFSEQVLKGGTHKEVLLLQAQLLPRIRLVVRVEHGREVLGTAPLLDRVFVVARVESVEVELVRGARAPKPQVIGVVCVKARDEVVVGHGLDDFASDPALAPRAPLVCVVLHPPAEAHRVDHVRPRDLPRDQTRKPVVWLLHLAAVHDVLLEDAVGVADAVAPHRQGQRRHRVKEARGQAAEAAVAEARVRLVRVELLQLEPQAHERVFELWFQVQVHERVLEVAAHEVLCRQIVSPLHVLLGVPSVGVVEGLQ
mmetsp:Transcript_63644/g.177030  ORF Transcript_63644/g.177030 Transcript_63644/m.177030 type:complete len:278 (-) Transcript_63644:376-1209(-)